jgi:transposase
MNTKFTIEQLQNCSKDEMIAIVLQMQQENALFAEKLAVWEAARFGRKTEKLEEFEGQLNIFNEVEALVDEQETEEAAADETNTSPRKAKREAGFREKTLHNLPVRIVSHELSDDELIRIFGENGWKRLPDRVYTKVEYMPAVHEAQEHHIAVYASKKDDTIIRAEHPAELWDNSIASPSLVAGVMNAKYTNHMPLYRIEQEYDRAGITVPRATLANWVIRSSERYLSLLWDRLKQELCSLHVAQADETSLLVAKDGRNAGSKSYMWVYRTGAYEQSHPIILYDYQKTRNGEHPAKFLAEFSGVLVCDAYSGYYKLERNSDKIQIANCWAHCRRHFANALKALKGKEKKHAPKTLAHRALALIASIYAEDQEAAKTETEKRELHRRQKVEPLVEAYFAWVRAHKDDVPPNSETGMGFEYSLNQEAYLKVFLSNGEVPMDNSASERAIRPFTVGRKNWQMIDTLHGAQASAILYSIVETAKANNLKPYEYLRVLLTEIPKHTDGKDLSFLDDLLPWADALPDCCRKPIIS